MYIFKLLNAVIFSVVRNPGSIPSMLRSQVIAKLIAILDYNTDKDNPRFIQVGSHIFSTGNIEDTANTRFYLDYMNETAILRYRKAGSSQANIVPVMLSIDSILDYIRSGDDAVFAVNLVATRIGSNVVTPNIITEPHRLEEVKDLVDDLKWMIRVLNGRTRMIKYLLNLYIKFIAARYRAVSGVCPDF
jgi:hypothetical protein